MQEVCRQYWPMGRGSSETYSKYTVTFNKQEIHGDYVVRKMEITESDAKMSVSIESFTVTQF